MSQNTIRIAAAQTVEYLNDITSAIDCLIDEVRKADAFGARLVCFPEGFLQGYLTDDLAARSVALNLASATFSSIIREFPSGPMIVFGMIEMAGVDIFNTAVVVQNGILMGSYRKAHLMGGESSFGQGTESPIFTIDELRFGINICYDTNFAVAASRLAQAGASLIVCPTNNMMPLEKAERYKDIHNAVRGNRCRETGLWLISADVTGSRDGRVGIGPTAVLNPQGLVRAQLPPGKPGLLVFDLPLNEVSARSAE